jgi:hypothetical protein
MMDSFDNFFGVKLEKMPAHPLFFESVRVPEGAVLATKMFS